MLANVKSFGLMALLLCSGLYAAQPYDSVRPLQQDPYFVENGYILSNKVSSTNTVLFVDVDSPNGDAARFIAAVNNTVNVFAINSWSEEERYHRFLSNVFQDGTGDRITALRMSSEEAAKALNLNAGVIFLDSSDSVSLGRKIQMWLTQVAEGGVIAGNHWESTAVELAVVTAAAELNLVLSTNGNYWFLSHF